MTFENFTHSVFIDKCSNFKAHSSVRPCDEVLSVNFRRGQNSTACQELLRYQDAVLFQQERSAMEQNTLPIQSLVRSPR